MITRHLIINYRQMLNIDKEHVTTLLLPSIDSYHRGYQKQVIQNCDTLQKLSTDYLDKTGQRITSLEQRYEALKAREKKIYETVQNLSGAKSIIRIETPRIFPSEIDYDVTKVYSEVTKSDKTLAKNQALEAQIEKDTRETFSLHDPKIKGDEPKITNSELNDAIKSICQGNRVPLIYPVNIQQQNGHLDKLYLPRTHQTKRKMKYIDSSLIFNTKNSIFYHFVPDRPAEKRGRAKTNANQVANPILDSGNLANFNITLQRHDDALESGYVPKTTNQITLLDAPTDSLFGDTVMDFNFLNDKSNALFGGETNFYFDELMKQKPAPTSQPSTPSPFQSDPLSSSTLQGPSGQTSTGPTFQQPSQGSIQPPITNMQPVPAPPPGSIPPPPPLAVIQSLANAKADKKDEDGGGNVADSSAPLKPITEEKSSLLLPSDHVGRDHERKLQAEESRGQERREDRESQRRKQDLCRV
jgi:hypothetical protein